MNEKEIKKWIIMVFSNSVMECEELGWYKSLGPNMNRINKWFLNNRSELENLEWAYNSYLSIRSNRGNRGSLYGTEVGNNIMKLFKKWWWNMEERIDF